MPKEKKVKPAADQYFEGVGRRKTALARVRISPGQNGFLINGQDCQQYFPNSVLQKIIFSPLKENNLDLGVKAKVLGGGVPSQAEAIRLGLSRALVKFQPDSYKKLRQLGFLTRDPRMRERKKPGLKRARRAPQWQKR